MKRLLWIFLVAYCSAQLPTTFKVQEAIYPSNAWVSANVATNQFLLGSGGITRSNEPVSVGIPIRDADAITNLNCLTLDTVTGHPTLWQFRQLGIWGAAGNNAWVQVDAELPSYTGGTPDASSIVLKPVSCGTGGNSAGSPLAVDSNDCTGAASGFICVTTGAAKFTIKKANHDGFHQVVVGSTTMLGASTGLAIQGPNTGGTSFCTAPGSTDCTTLYTSANDAGSNATIEQNGPVKAVVKVTGMLASSATTCSGQVSATCYLRYTIRYTFWAGKTWASASVILQNADEGASNTFVSAYKGYRSLEFRLSPAALSIDHFAFGDHTGAANATAFTGGSDNAYLYQGYSTDLDDIKDNGSGNANTAAYGAADSRHFTSPIFRTTGTNYAQNGYQLTHAGSNIITGTSIQYPQGWGDFYNGSNGNGIEVGIYQMAATWPKAIQAINEASEIRVGIQPDQASLWTGSCNSLSPCTIPYFAAWPQYQKQDLWFDFHVGTISEANEFLSWQHPLVAVAGDTTAHTIAYYNNACSSSFSFCALPYKLTPPAAEASFWLGIHTPWTPSTAIVPNEVPFVQRFWQWQNGGTGNQAEYRVGAMERWFTRGFVGAYLANLNFQTFILEQGWPRADVRSGLAGASEVRSASTCGVGDGVHYDWACTTLPINNFGNPCLGCGNGSAGVNVISLNQGYANRQWGNIQDEEHQHVWGVIYTYLMTGDESLKDLILSGPSGQWMNPNLCINIRNCDLITRANGVDLLGKAHLYRFYTWMGDAASATALQTQANNVFTTTVFPEACGQAGGVRSPVGCTPPSPNQTGQSSTRGNSLQNDTDSNVQYCSFGVPAGGIFCSKAFMHSTLIEGIYDSLLSYGTGWTNYIKAKDAAYGMSQWFEHEPFVVPAGTWWSGMVYGVDQTQAQPSMSSQPTGSTIADYQFPFHYLAWYRGKLSTAEQNLFVNSYGNFLNAGGWKLANNFNIDMFMTSLAIDDINNPATNTLSAILPVTVTGCTVASGTCSFTGSSCKVTSGAPASLSCALSWTIPASPPFVQSWRVKAFGCVNGGSDTNCGPNGKPIVDWIGFDPTQNQFSSSAVACTALLDCSGTQTTQPWFSSTEITTGGCPPVAGSNTCTVSGLSIANVWNFAVRPTMGAGAPVVPSLQSSGGSTISQTNDSRPIPEWWGIAEW